MAKWLGFDSYGLLYEWDYGHIQVMKGYSESDIINKKYNINEFM